MELSPMSNKRLKIISQAEINELYDLPQFTDSERKTYFSLSKKEYKLMTDRGSLASKVHFILQLGYFKATSLFFNCTFKDVQSDVDFIIQEYLGNAKMSAKSVSKQTRHTNQNSIAKHLKYECDKSSIKDKLANLLKTKTRLCNNPVYLFHEILCYSSQHMLMLLNYSTLQDLIGTAITDEEARLCELLQKHLNASTWASIKTLLTIGDSGYVLTALKKDPKSFNHKQIKGEIKKLNDHQALYVTAKTILPKLKLSQQNIIYYANLAMHHPINELKKLSTTKQAIYTLCYVHHRHQKINDNLTVSYFHYLTKYNEEARTNAKEYVFNEKLEINKDAKKAAVVLRFYDDETITDKETFGRVRKRAYKHIKKGRFSMVSDYLDGVLFDYQAIKWDEISKLKSKYTRNLRPIFKALEFGGANSQAPTLAAIKFLKNYFSKPHHQRKALLGNAPITCIPIEWRKHLMVTPENGEEDSKMVVDIAKYEFMVYQLIAEQVESGLLFLSNSISFKSLSSHLVSDKKWRNKTALLTKLGNNKLLLPVDKLLDQLEEELEQLIKSVNENIEKGDTKGIKIKKDGDKITFTLPYPKSADRANHPVFKQLKQVSIAEVLQFVQKDCGFMQEFTHIKPYDAKDILDPTAMMACIIANATNLGIYKMAETSDLDYHQMHTQMKNFIRLETLRDANDVISNAIAKLPIFKYWNIHDDRIHGSVDGQKFETRLHSFIARYSSKYFGVNKGVVAYTLCANHIPVNARVISANHHESHYLFDILFNNSSEIDINWLSGDGHSINQVNFALLDFIDKQFAPHFKSISRKSDTLYGFKSLGKYKDLLIKPNNKIQRKLIKSEWDTIQRIIASLLLGETSQHLIVSKLSSHKRKNKTKEALREYDKILMSIYMLNFMNDPSIRKNVRRALNRGEAYHQLRRAIANVHGRKFRGSSERELEIWNECARLMGNCMIYYNAKILDALLSKLQKEGRVDQLEHLKYISPVAWCHINLHGYYMFEGQQNLIDLVRLAGSINMLKSA